MCRMWLSKLRFKSCINNILTEANAMYLAPRVNALHLLNHYMNY